MTILLRSQLENAQFLHDTYFMNCKSYTEAIAKYQTELPFEIQRNNKEKERERKQKEKVWQPISEYYFTITIWYHGRTQFKHYTM